MHQFGAFQEDDICTWMLAFIQQRHLERSYILLRENVLTNGPWNIILHLLIGWLLIDQSQLWAKFIIVTELKAYSGMTDSEENSMGVDAASMGGWKSIAR